MASIIVECSLVNFTYSGSLEVSGRFKNSFFIWLISEIFFLSYFSYFLYFVVKILKTVIHEIHEMGKIKRKIEDITKNSN